MARDITIYNRVGRAEGGFTTNHNQHKQEEPLMVPTLEREYLPDTETPNPMKREYADDLKIIENRIEQFEHEGVMVPTSLLEQREIIQDNIRKAKDSKPEAEQASNHHGNGEPPLLPILW